jgi:hypothetical protein
MKIYSGEDKRHETLTSITPHDPGSKELDDFAFYLAKTFYGEPLSVEGDTILTSNFGTVVEYLGYEVIDYYEYHKNVFDERSIELYKLLRRLVQGIPDEFITGNLHMCNLLAPCNVMLRDIEKALPNNKKVVL